MADPFFDTNILIDWLTGVQFAEAELARYPRHRIARPVWTEIIALEPEETRNALARLIAPFEVVEIDARIASAAASLAHRSKMKLQDALILATAQVNGAILITRNVHDFPANMPGIRIPYTL